ncbi:MAG: 2-C-methyl-D-erythritol 2,4-cyclodiphosphate synthase [bacterium]
MRVGYGYDVHALVKGRKLMLGGVHIPFTKGLKGHSDADVLLHAICDALLGAISAGDIGKHFPNSDKKYKNISSLILLGEVRSMVEQRGFVIENIDSVIIAEKPQLGLYFLRMRQSIAKVLNISLDRVNVKASTSEGLGFVGRGKGIVSYAACLVEATKSYRKKAKRK